MTEIPKPIGPAWILIAADMADSVPEFVQLAASLAPQTRFEDLPPISDADEVDLWCYLDDLMSEDEEAAFEQKVTQVQALQAHLSLVVQQQRANQTVPEPVAPAAPTTSSGRPLAPADLVVIVSRDQLRRPARDRQRGMKLFDLARNDAELPTSIQEQKLTSVGTLRLTIDLISPGTCQILIEPVFLTVAANELSCVWADTASQKSTEQPFPDREGSYIRFSGLSPGRHEIQLRHRSADVERIVIDLVPFAGETST